MVNADWPYAREQFKSLAEIELRRHFRAVRPAHSRQAHRAEQDRIELLAALESLRGQGIAAAQVFTGSNRKLLEVKAHTAEPAFDGAQDLHCFGDHVRANAVSRQDGDM